MSTLDSAHEDAPVEMLEARSRVTARVMTTVVLPPEALTIIAPAPEMISQINVEQVLGIPPRAYLELLREPGCPVEVVRVGKLRVVDRSQLRGWLEVRAKAKRAAAATEAAPDDDQLPVEDQVRLGIKPAPRTAARRR